MDLSQQTKGQLRVSLWGRRNRSRRTMSCAQPKTDKHWMRTSESLPEGPKANEVGTRMSVPNQAIVVSWVGSSSSESLFGKNKGMKSQNERGKIKIASGVVEGRVFVLETAENNRL